MKNNNQDENLNIYDKNDNDKDDIQTKFQNKLLSERIEELERDIYAERIKYIQLSAERNGLRDERDGLLVERDSLRAEHDGLLVERDSLRAEHDGLRAERNGLHTEYDGLCAKYDSIRNKYITEIEIWKSTFNTINESGFWKMTKPARIVFDFFKRKYRKYTESHAKKRNADIYITEDKVDYTWVEESAASGGLMAVHLHLFYEDLLEEFCQYLNNIPYIFDIYVSVSKKDNIRKIKKQLRTIRCADKIIVKQTPNKGRDIAPFWIYFKKELCRYDYLLHIHSKKSLYSGSEQDEWRRNMMNRLLGSPSLVRKVITLFENHNVGLFFPETTNMPLAVETWLANTHLGKELCEKLSIPFEEGHFNYPVGSFFWSKKDAIQAIFDLNLTYNDLPDEPLPNDGTILHTLERVLALAVRGKDYRNSIYEMSHGMFCFNKCLSLYREYGALSALDFNYILGSHEVISFDIFDTLITRIVLKPDDVFSLIEPQAKKIYNKDEKFIVLRKKAEQNAMQKYAWKTTIHHIYESFAELCGITKEAADKIKALEIDAELTLCIPRKDMLTLFNYTKQFKHKVILISDMYLTSDIISKMLNRCGYNNWDELLVSCDSGCRKDTGTMWSWFKETHDLSSHIHVGDNSRSDVQIPGDMGIKTAYVLSSYNNFKLSDLYDKYKKYIDNSIENSLILGYMVNKLLFNSPFTGINSELNPEIKDMKTVGNGLFAPVLFSFCYDLAMSANTEQYLFLSREGYVLKKIYDIISKGLNKPAPGSNYLYTSRRAVSVASIENENDIREMLDYYFSGKLKSMVSARFGDNISDMIKSDDKYINLPGGDIDDVIRALQPFNKEILLQAKRENKEYLKYLRSIIGADKDIAVVDIGYSGTIQKYLVKMLQRKIDGYYLILWVEKNYSFSSSLNGVYNKKDRINKMHLFLESVLVAPNGQLLYMEKGMPVFKEHLYDHETPVREIHEGIFEYAKSMTELIKRYLPSFKPDYELLEEIQLEITNEALISKEIYKKLNVEDDFSSGGTINCLHAYRVNNKAVNNISNTVTHSDIRYHIDEYKIEDGKLSLYGWCLLLEYESNRQNVYVEFQGSKTFMARKVPNEGVAVLFNDQKYIYSSFLLVLEKDEYIPSDDSRMRIILENEGVFYEVAKDLKQNEN